MGLKGHERSLTGRRARVLSHGLAFSTRFLENDTKRYRKNSLGQKIAAAALLALGQPHIAGGGSARRRARGGLATWGGRSGGGFHPAMMRAHLPALWSLISGKWRLNSTMPDNSPPSS